MGRGPWATWRPGVMAGGGVLTQERQGAGVRLQMLHCCLRMGGRGRQPRDSGSLWKVKKTRNNSPLGPSRKERNQSSILARKTHCRRLTFWNREGIHFSCYKPPRGRLSRQQWEADTPCDSGQTTPLSGQRPPGA